MKKTEVYILGQKYTIKGETTEADIRELAAYVDLKIKEVLHMSPNLSHLNAVILASMNMAEEVQSLRDEQEHFTKRILEGTDRLFEIID